MPSDIPLITPGNSGLTADVPVSNISNSNLVHAHQPVEKPTLTGNFTKHDQMIEVLRAADRGEEIQRRKSGTDDVWVLDPDPKWNFAEHDYRIATENVRTGFINVYADGNMSIHSSFEDATTTSSFNSSPAVVQGIQQEIKFT